MAGFFGAVFGFSALIGPAIAGTLVITGFATLLGILHTLLMLAMAGVAAPRSEATAGNRR